jgi:intraflagellar transport protein 140
MTTVYAYIDDNQEEDIEDSFLRVYFKVMRDFIGLEEVDDATKAALLDFSFYLTLGKLDEAYRAGEQ